MLGKKTEKLDPAGPFCPRGKGVIICNWRDRNVTESLSSLFFFFGGAFVFPGNWKRGEWEDGGGREPFRLKKKGPYIAFAGYFFSRPCVPSGKRNGGDKKHMPPGMQSAVQYKYRQSQPLSSDETLPRPSAFSLQRSTKEKKKKSNCGLQLESKPNRPPGRRVPAQRKTPRHSQEK